MNVVVVDDERIVGYAVGQNGALSVLEHTDINAIDFAVYFNVYIILVL